jgi:large subunit ribosomal protein L29
MDAKTLRQKTKEALVRELQDSKDKLKTLEFKLSSNQVKNVREVRVVKKTIARIKTLMKELVNKENEIIKDAS